MRINDVYAQIEKEREAEQQAALALATQRGRIAGLQTALELLDVRPKAVQPSGIVIPADLSKPSVIEKTPTFVGPVPKKPRKAPPANTTEARAAAKQLRRERIQRMIEVLTAESPLGPGAIAHKSHIPEGSIHRLLDDPTFARQPDGRWALAVQTSAPVEPAKVESPKVEPAKPAEVKPAPKAKPAKPVSENTRAYRRHKIAQTLSGGSLTLIEVARKINLTYDDALEICQDDPWFSQDPAGRWHITPQCRSEFFDDSNPATGD